MAYAGTPVVRNQLVWLSNAATNIQLDTPGWFLWLQTATSFSYPLGRPTDYRLTLRKEKRRHGWYWYAYLKTDSKLHNSYVGRSENLTTERLGQVAQKLMDKVTQAQRAASAKGGDMTR